MTQKRIVNYNDPITDTSILELSSSLVTSSRLRGFEMSAYSAGVIAIAPGVGVTHEGVIIKETEQQLLPIALQSSPSQHTVYYQHENQQISGGIAAVLVVEDRLLSSENINGFLIGYINHPGGVPLNSTHFIQPPVLKVGQVLPTPYSADWLLPTFDVMAVNIVGSVSVSRIWEDDHLEWNVVNTSLSSIGSTELIFPFKVMDSAYSRLELLTKIGASSLITPILIDSSSEYWVLGSSITNIVNFSVVIKELNPEAIQEPNSIVYIKLQVQLAANDTVKIRAVGLNRYNLPAGV